MSICASGIPDSLLPPLVQKGASGPADHLFRRLGRSLYDSRSTVYQLIYCIGICLFSCAVSIRSILQILGKTRHNILDGLQAVFCFEAFFLFPLT